MYLGLAIQASGTSIPELSESREVANERQTYGALVSIPAKRRDTQGWPPGESTLWKVGQQKHRSLSHCVLQRRGVRDRHNLCPALEIRLPEPIPGSHIQPFERIAR